jgi:hypothetical protein
VFGVFVLVRSFVAIRLDVRGNRGFIAKGTRSPCVEAQLQSREREQLNDFFFSRISFHSSMHIISASLPLKTYIMRQKVFPSMPPKRS